MTGACRPSRRKDKKKTTTKRTKRPRCDKSQSSCNTTTKSFLFPHFRHSAPQSHIPAFAKAVPTTRKNKRKTKKTPPLIFLSATSTTSPNPIPSPSPPPVPMPSSAFRSINHTVRTFPNSDAMDDIRPPLFFPFLFFSFLLFSSLLFSSFLFSSHLISSHLTTYNHCSLVGKKQDDKADRRA